MTPHFLFPASPLNGRMIDEAFQDQAIALKMAGFGTSALTDDMKIVGAVPEGATVVYRGWMLDVEHYQLMLDKLAARPLTPLTTLEQYLFAHHLPNWYPLVEPMTPETLIFPDGNMTDWKMTVAAGWEKIQVKDYVKSLKTGAGSVTGDPAKITEILANMQKYRGTIEGGICLRRWEEFIPDSEKRYFILNGRYYGQEQLLDMRTLELLERVTESATPFPSPFVSVAIAERVDGVCRIVEIGDGQVSDLVGWTPERFAEIWKWEIWK